MDTILEMKHIVKSDLLPVTCKTAPFSFFFLISFFFSQKLC